MTLQSLTRFKAFLLHFCISVFIAAGVVVVVVVLWYPSPYFDAMGGATLLRLLIGVDVVIGPLITFLVFDPKKPHLKFDLATIAVLQVAALAYGGYVMFSARPVFTVFADGRFHTVPANAIDVDSLARASPEFRSLSLTGPRVVASRFPDDPQETAKVVAETAMGGADLADLPHLYVPYAQDAGIAAAAARPLVTLAQGSKESADRVNEFLTAHASGGRNLGFIPVTARNRDFSAVVDRKTGEIVGYLRIDPR